MHPDISEFSSSIDNTEIVYIKNFLDKESCSYLVKAIETALSDRSFSEELYERINDGKATDDDSPYIYLFHYPDYQVKVILQDIIERSISIYEDKYGKDPDINFINLGTVVTRRPGSSLNVHADDAPGLDKDVTTPHGMILYLNDDYEGGEIYYPDLKIAIKPETGSLVIHPGTADYAHGVVPVESGIRYVTTAFTKKKIVQI